MYARIVTNHIYLGQIYGPSSSASNVPYEIALDTKNYHTDASDGQIIISWDPASPTDLQGLPFDHYEVLLNGVWIISGMQPSYTFSSANGVMAGALSRTVTLHPDPTVGFVYGSYNPYGSKYDTAYKKVDALSNVVANAYNTSINISWDGLDWYSSKWNGAEPNKYQVSINQVDWIDIGVSNPSAHLFTGLTNGQSYIVSVRAVTTVQYTENGNTLVRTIEGVIANATNIPYRIAAAPTLISNPTSQQIGLSWATPDLGGLLIDHYEISYDNGSVWSSLASNSLFITSPSSSSVTFNSLNNGTTYTYYIKAITLHPILGLFVGTSSNVSVVPFLKPSVVSNIIASTINGSMAFSFTPPADVNNNVLTQYYEYSIDNFVTINQLFQFTSLTIPIMNTNVFSLSIRSYILNPNDNITHVSGDYTTLSNLQNINVTTPQNLQASVKSSEVTLTWSAVPGVTFRVIKYITTGANFKEDVIGSSYTFSGLTNGIIYNFGVCMVASGITGPVSNISATPITAPSINSITIVNGVLLLNINFGGAPSISIDVDVSVSIEITYMNIQPFPAPPRSSQEIVSIISTIKNFNNPLVLNTGSIISYYVGYADSYNYAKFTVINSVGSVSGTKFL